MIAAIALFVFTAQVRTLDLPKISYEIPVCGGQREIILGPKPIESALLNGYYEHDVAAKHIATGDDTAGGYVDSWQPGGTEEASLGYFDSVTRADTLFDKPCFVVTTTAKWNQTLGRRPHEVKVQNYAKQQWWISPEGKILRHYYQLQTPEGTQSGDCTYGKDSVQRRYTDVSGKTVFGEVFPSCGMQGLDAQFKPMVEDGKVVLRDKDFWVLNPLTGGLEKYSAHVSGTFKGTFLSASFKGRLFDIDGPDRKTQRVFIDDTGDMVKVALDDEHYFVISVVPKSHLDEYGRPKSGGG